MDTLDPKQQEELDRLNRALEEQKFLPDDKKLLRSKMYNPQTGELQLFADNGKGGVKLTSVNLLGD